MVKYNLGSYVNILLCEGFGILSHHVGQVSLPEYKLLLLLFHEPF